MLLHPPASNDSPIFRPATSRRRLLALAAAAAGLSPAAGFAKPRGPRFIGVSLGQQMLWAYRGDQLVLSTAVSTGKAGFETPVGRYAVINKLPSQTMEGVIGGEYYNVPDVPWVLYFTDRGHAIHGTYWHSNFGTPMSHGCVNLPLDPAAWLYEWAPLGTPIRVVL
jgi:lipoprotein-anchoring transpeptidase ErfK/SrfK